MVASTFSKNSIGPRETSRVESTHSYHSAALMKTDREEISDDRFVEGSFLNDESSVQSKSITTTTNADSDERHKNPNLNGNKSHDGNNSFKIAEREDIFVTRMKIIVVISLVLSSTALALVIFFLAQREELDHFESEFIDLATEIQLLISHNRENVLKVLEMLAVTTTALGIHENASWPFYTIPNYEQRTTDILKIAKSDLVMFTPTVSTNERSEWDTFAQSNTYWISDGIEYQNMTIKADYIDRTTSEIILPKLHSDHEDPFRSTIPLATSGPFIPAWQVSACPTDLSIINYDLLQNTIFKNVIGYVNTIQAFGMTKIFNTSELLGSASEESISHQDRSPQSLYIQPIFENFSNVSSIIGYYVLQLTWSKYLENILQEKKNGFICVVKNTCMQSYTYELNGPEVIYVGEGDLHDPKYDYIYAKMPIDQVDLKMEQSTHDEELPSCDYYISIHPSSKLRDVYISPKPFYYLSIVFVIFVCTSLVFVLYDVFVTRRQTKVLHTAARTHQIVGSLFPEAVRDQLLKEQEAAELERKKNANKGGGFNLAEVSNRAGLRNFFSDTAHANGNGDNDPSAMKQSKDSNGDSDSSKPIADLFPNTTIMFADINGFTAWSSVREPCQVFTLLETVYHGFDQIARARRVFKVETVGDCYVAVAGLPDPRHDHAVVMARFARDCVNHMNDLVVKLCFSLGPGTEDLRIRVGLHSGPVTAGVLRGERSRFQLFGDTMNTAARMETTGLRNKIHISQETADFLLDANKGHWIQPRKDVVVAKGKGALHTYWLLLNPKSGAHSSGAEKTASEAERSSSAGSHNADASSNGGDNEISLSTKHQRLVDWNSELLLQLLKKIIARRKIKRRNYNMNILDETILEDVEEKLRVGGSCLNDIVEVIEMPDFNAKAAKTEVDPRTIDVGDTVVQQVHEYVGMLASMYRDNPFHCFEHASHVTMSVSKLLGRIVAPDAVVDAAAENDHHEHKHEDLEAAMHDHTYGITSDPLTQFSVVLSGLIHDVDHRGVPNYVLLSEEPSLSLVYHNKSVAEQNSVDIAWKTLMEPRFEQFRRCIYEDEAELLRFRHLVVNSVMATDVFDKELDAIRKARWNKAFHEEQTSESQKQNIDRKATIVIEHLIQASDVAHTMQHWHVYQQWNARLFEEMYKAYQDGRTQKDPAEGWYQGELWFFDNYVIPLAKKLKECGVFGVSSDEYLNYAIENRREWEKKGQNIVGTLLQKWNAKQSSESGDE